MKEILVKITYSNKSEREHIENLIAVLRDDLQYSIAEYDPHYRFETTHNEDA